MAKILVVEDEPNNLELALRIVRHGTAFPHASRAEKSRKNRAVSTMHVSASVTNGGTRQGAEKLILQEWHYYFQNTL